MLSLPAGTLTFLFTDIEGSTRLLERLGDGYADVLAEHHRLLRAAFEKHGGIVFGTQGDALFVAFARALDAVLAAVETQRALGTRRWPEDIVLRVRMGLHTGEPLVTETGYVGVDVHRAARISGAGHGGQILVSETTRELVLDALPEGVALRDLGAHRLKDLSRPLRLFQVTADSLPSDFPALRSLDARHSNLPIQLTSFIGREREKAEIRRLLGTTRVLTLVGPGGVGKTRLAVQVGAELVEDFPDGVWFVDLAPLVDPRLVPHAIAVPLGVREPSGRPLLRALSDHLQSRRLVLILDSCEHLARACADLAFHLLRSAPRLQMLVTSRQPLQLAGEMTWHVPPMSLPMSTGQAIPEPLAFDAIRLFVERARLVHSGFALSDGAAATVLEICRRLEGLPLPIELAAARLGTLSLGDIRDRLNDRFRLLSTTLRGIPERHLTERAAIDWSYDLLIPSEQILFGRASVFRGGFTLEAAEHVCSGGGTSSDQILDLLTGLVDKSMVVVEHGGLDHVRYRLLEPLREYGWEQLRTAGGVETIQAAHADYFTELGERAAPELAGAAQSTWLARLDAERDNLRSAMQWWISQDDASGASRLAAALAQFWFVRGYFTEARHRLSEILHFDRLQAAGLDRARALAIAGRFAWAQGDLTESKRLHEEALAICRRLDDRKGISVSLAALAIIASSQGEPELARRLHEEVLIIDRELDDQAGIARTLNNLGLLLNGRGEYVEAGALFQEKLRIEQALGNSFGIALALAGLGAVATNQGDYASAQMFYEESLGLRRQMGDKTGIAATLSNMGVLATLQGNLPEARRMHEEGLALAREAGVRITVANALVGLGETAVKEGDFARARAALQETLATASELGAKIPLAAALEGLAVVAVGDRQPERALRLAGAAASLREGQGIRMHPVTAAEHERMLDQARVALGPEASEAAWSDGKSLPIEQTVTYALAPATSVRTGHESRPLTATND